MPPKSHPGSGTANSISSRQRDRVMVHGHGEQDSSPTRQFTDTGFEDSSPTDLKTVHRHF